MENIPLLWNANSESDLAGYRIHWGSVSSLYTDPDSPKTVGLVTAASIDVQPNGMKFISLTAYNTGAQDSLFAIEISKNCVLPFSGVAVFRGGPVRAPARTVRQA
jgi:hypothetical protein